MTRPLRIEYAGVVYHITSRGNEKKAVFKDDQDRINFLNTLQHVNKRYNWLCHAYCMMDNHYHLLIETPDGNLSLGMRQMNGVYTQLFNKRHQRTGHLFQADKADPHSERQPPARSMPVRGVKSCPGTDGRTTGSLEGTL